MEWKKFVLTTTTQAVEPIGAVLMENGIDSFEIEDKQQISDKDKEAMYIDILPELSDDGKARVIFYMDMETDSQEQQRVLDSIMADVAELKEYVDTGDVTITESVTDELDWVNKWKEFFKPFTVDGILIRPTWEQVENESEYDMVIKIDPGTAFGTGLHETTQLCIRQLEKYIGAKSGELRILDVGCGSGILSVIARKLGAASVLGIDIDRRAVEASKENAIENEVLEHIEFIEGNIIQNQELQHRAGYDCYDIVVANILADVIIPLSGMMAPHLKSGGIFITSGIIESKEKEVVKAIEENEEFVVVEVTRQKDWVSVTARRR